MAKKKKKVKKAVKRIKKKPAKRKISKKPRKKVAARPRKKIAAKPRRKPVPKPKKKIIEVPKAHIVINEDLCKGCGICVDICPRQVFEMSTKINKSGVHPAKVKRAAQCIICYECELHCPDMAISVTPAG